MAEYAITWSPLADRFLRKNWSIDGSAPISSTVRYTLFARVVVNQASFLAEITSLSGRLCRQLYQIGGWEMDLEVADGTHRGHLRALNEFGVLDHQLRLEPGEPLYNYAVTADRAGSE